VAHRNVLWKGNLDNWTILTFWSKPKQGEKNMKQTFKFTKYIVVLVMVGLMMGSGLPMASASKNAPVS